MRSFAGKLDLCLEPMRFADCIHRPSPLPTKYLKPSGYAPTYKPTMRPINDVCDDDRDIDDCDENDDDCVTVCDRAREIRAQRALFFAFVVAVATWVCWRNFLLSILAFLVALIAWVWLVG